MINSINNGHALKKSQRASHSLSSTGPGNCSMSNNLRSPNMSPGALSGHNSSNLREMQSSRHSRAPNKCSHCRFSRTFSAADINSISHHGLLWASRTRRRELNWKKRENDPSNYYIYFLKETTFSTLKLWLSIKHFTSIIEHLPRSHVVPYS